MILLLLLTWSLPPLDCHGALDTGTPVTYSVTWATRSCTLWWEDYALCEPIPSWTMTVAPAERGWMTVPANAVPVPGAVLMWREGVDKRGEPVIVAWDAAGNEACR